MVFKLCSHLLVNATLSNDRVGIAVILDAANGTGYVEPKIIQPALSLLVNLVCPPPSISNKPPLLTQGQQSIVQTSNGPTVEMRDRNAERNITDQTVQMPSQNELRERNADMSGIERGSSAVFSTTSSSNTSQTPASIVTSGLVGDRRISLGAGAGCAGLVAQLEQGYHQAREAVRANNGIKVLLQLLQPRVVTPPGALDCLRALACRVLLGLSRNDTIAHKLTRLQVCNSEHCSCTTNSCFKSFWNSTAVPQMSIGRAGTSPSIQYGISNLPVFDKPAPVRISSLLTPRHLSQRRIRFPARKYHPKKEGPKVPFFCNDEETPSTPKADALFIPRENPRALAIRPMEQWPGRANREERTPSKDMSRALENAEDIVESGLIKELGNPVKLCQKSNGVCDDHLIQKGDSYITLTGQRAGEAAIVYEHGADIEALMPKLRHSDYYTEPRIQELAAKERAEPGFCHHVKDFVVGRHGYGSIKFLGETDVRRLDLESLIQFNHREVIVYMDESKKPPVGQGLNKPAVVTLLNIKCFDKKTGSHYTEGPKIDKYKDMLGKKAEDQGADFVSYDPIKGEWKFKVNHFSEYGLGDEDD